MSGMCLPLTTEMFNKQNLSLVICFSPFIQVLHVTAVELKQQSSNNCRLVSPWPFHRHTAITTSTGTWCYNYTHMSSNSYIDGVIYPAHLILGWRSSYWHQQPTLATGLPLSQPSALFLSFGTIYFHFNFSHCKNSSSYSYSDSNIIRNTNSNSSSKEKKEENEGEK